VQLVHDYLLPTRNDALVDLYCGVGLFCLALADQVGHVLGVEAEPSAIADFRHNAQGMDHVELAEGKAHAILRHLDEEVDLLVLDPPRSGAGKEVVNEIVRLGPRRLTYVSCDPATLARDARHLIDCGYSLQEVQPIDLFPQTYHVESVANFVRGD